MKSNGHLTISFMIIVVLAGCGSTPNALLDSARSSYRNAQSNPEVTNFAPLELKQAGDTLAQADDVWKLGRDPAKVNQLAYLAQQQVAIAQETAKRKAAEEDVSVADAKRNKQRAQSAEMRANALESQLKELNAKKKDRGTVIIIGDVLFDTDRVELKKSGVRELQKLADVLKQNPQRNVAIEGFTDSTGSEDFNQKLSERRANAVRVALMNMGIDIVRIKARGYGESFPVASNDNKTGRRLNRRVEVFICDDSGEIRPR